MDQGAEHNKAHTPGSLFYEGPLQLTAKEGSLGCLTSNETIILDRHYVKPQQGRCMYGGGLMEGSCGLINSQESIKRLKVQGNENQQELLLGPSFQYAGVIEGSSSTSNVRSSLVVESSTTEASLFKRSAHVTNSMLNPSTIPIALPLLSNSSTKNDPPLLQDLPWFANHALEEEEVVGQAAFPLVRPNGVFPIASLNNFNNTSSNNNRTFPGAAATSSLISLLGENDAQHSILQAHIVAHPLFEQLLGAHLACLRMATPPERWPDAYSLDTRLALSRQELDAKYLLLARNAPPPHDRDNLDHFMLSFTLLLQTFREQLREHMQLHSAEASSGCAEIKNAFFRLTGETSLSEAESMSTMSEDEDMVDDEDDGMHHTSVHDGSMYSPLNMASEMDKSLMESVRKELKLELKQNYRNKLWDVREEIMRKRRAGKLPGTTTSLLKDWWDAHSKWPYPTEEEKLQLVQETGLELKQINNWFINQRKRNWNTNPAAALDRAEMDELSLYGSFHPSC